jgi:hypothetical protein
MDLKEIGREDMEWINLDEETEKWQPVHKHILNFGCHKMQEIARLVDEPLASKEE